MHFLVTGAGGFIGIRVVSLLLQSGHSVQAVLRSDGAGFYKKLRVLNLNLNHFEKLTVVNVDLRKPDILDGILGHVETVIHLAASKSGPLAVQLENNVQATCNLLESVCRLNCKHFVLISSLAAIDPTGITKKMYYHSGRLKFTQGQTSLLHASAYAISKSLQEEISCKITRRANISLTILRPGVVVGPGQYLGGRINIPLGKWQMLPAPFARLPLVHVESCARQIVAAAVQTKSKPEDKVFNLIDTDRYRRLHYLILLQRLKIARYTLLPVPYRFLYILVKIIEILSRKLGGNESDRPELLRLSALKSRCCNLRYEHVPENFKSFLKEYG